MIDNGNNNEAATPEETQGEILSAEAFTMKSWAADCPYCDNLEEFGVDEPEVGTEVECVECGKTFRVGSVRDTN